MNTSQIKNFAIQSRSILKTGVLNRILTLGFDERGTLIVDRPVKIQGGTVFMDQLREESFYDAWIALESRLAKHGIKEVCEEAAYTWFNRLVAIRIMQKNHFIEPVMQYVSPASRIPIIVDQARSGRLSLQMTAQDRDKLDDLLRDSTKTNEQFNLLISAFCQANPVIFNCFGGIEKHIALLLPDSILSQGGFIDLLNNTPYLSDEDYTKSELIGWLYQFYISERKDEVFAKEGKYTPDEIPAATQIFTPNWIVKYMVENTIGRIYLDNNPYADEIRDGMKYLVDPSESTPKDVILKIEDLAEYKMIDNACGSGHILIEGFNLFYHLYLYEGYSSRQAIESILQKNIIGLDLDTRAKQLATFALLMTAAKIDKSFLDCKIMPRVLSFPEPFVYRGGTMEDFLSHYFIGASRAIIDETVSAFDLLKDAEVLGSIMKFDISDKTREAIKRSTEDWEKQEYIDSNIAAAIPSMKIILALTDKYSAAVMNPPYMGSGRFDSTLSQYVYNHYISGKADLFSVFMLVGMNCLEKNGKMGMINMQAWMFLSSFASLREHLIQSYHISSLLHLGSRTFDELSGEVVQNVAFVLDKYKKSLPSVFYRLISVKGCSRKEQLFLENNNSTDSKFVFRLPNQSVFEGIQGCSIGCYWFSPRMFEIMAQCDSLSTLGYVSGGRNKTHNNVKYVRYSWEVSKLRDYWTPYSDGGEFRKWYGNEWEVVDWSEAAKSFYQSHGGLLNSKFVNKTGITWNSGRTGFRVKSQTDIYSSSSPTVFDDKLEFDPMLLALLNSRVGKVQISVINPTLTLNPGDVLSVKLVKGINTVSIKERVVDCISISKQDWDEHEVSRAFTQNGLIKARVHCEQSSADMDMLDEDVTLESKDTMYTDNRLISHCIRAYKNDWIRKFEQLHSNEEELNRQFIEIYGLQNELTPDVPLDEITILQNGEISIENNEVVWHDDVLIKQLISYAVGCWMGRYRLDKEGLNIAHYPSEEEICTYEYNGAQFEIDDDAIIPIMGGNNPFEDDNALQKIINFVRIVFGEENLTKNLNYIEHCLGKSLESYLVKDFWKDHKKMYQNRPIYWLFSSKKGAFQVLTYMHRMNPYTVEKIRTKYLLPYIDYLKGRIEVDESRGSELSSVERANLAKMRVALDECNEYHDRLHEVAIQAIDFDLDDGVVVNYAKFGDVVAKIK